jgi:hypothetical protein
VTTTFLEVQEGSIDSFEDEPTAALPLRFAQPWSRAVLPKLPLHFVKVEMPLIFGPVLVI